MIDRPKSTLTCPTCGRKFQREATAAMPFCSDRCRLIDLRRWLDEEHSLPAEPNPEDDESAEGFGD